MTLGSLSIQKKHDMGDMDLHSRDSYLFFSKHNVYLLYVSCVHDDYYLNTLNSTPVGSDNSGWFTLKFHYD